MPRSRVLDSNVLLLQELSSTGAIVSLLQNSFPLPFVSFATTQQINDHSLPEPEERQQTALVIVKLPLRDTQERRKDFLFLHQRPSISVS